MKKYKLSDLADIIISSVDKKTKNGEKEILLCNFLDVYRNWAITKDIEQSLMKATANNNEIERFTIKKGQVAFTKDSETRNDIGISTYIADDFDNVILGYHNALVTPSKQLNGKFLNAFLHTKYISKYFEMNASGSGQRYSLSLQSLQEIPILLPSLAEQEALGNFFSMIDRKIALNKAINHNLPSLDRSSKVAVIHLAA